MKCKKKCIISIVIILIIAILFSLPFFFGIGTKKSLDYAIEQLAKEPGIDVSIKSYDRGWFSSHATIQIAIDAVTSTQAVWQYQMVNQGKTPPKFYLNINENIWHGPILYAPNFDGKNKFFFARSYALGDMQVPASELQSLPVNINKFDNKNNILVTLNGLIKVKSSLPMLTITSKDNKQAFSMQNFNVEYHLTSDFKKQKGQISLAHMNFADQNTSISINDVSHRFHLARALSHLWTGKSTLTIGNISASENSKQVFQQTSLQVKTFAEVANELLKLSINVEAGKFQLKDLVLDSGNLQLKVLNLGAKALNKLRVLDEQLQGEKLNSQQYFHAIAELTPDLFGHGAQLHLSPCEVNTPYGKVKLNFNITFPNIDKSHINDAKALFRNVESLNQITVPKTLVVDIMTKYYREKYAYLSQFVTDSNRQVMSQEEISKLVDSKVAALLQNWSQAEYLKEYNNNYQVNIGYKDGVLSINDKIIRR